MDVITNMWATWPWPLRIILDLLVITILIRGVVANELLKEMQERGILRGGLIATYRRFRERQSAIARHYDENHMPSLNECQEGSCQVFQATASSIPQTA